MKVRRPFIAILIAAGLVWISLDWGFGAAAAKTGTGAPQVLVGLARTDRVALAFSQEYRLVSGEVRRDLQADARAVLESRRGKIYVTVRSGNSVIFEGELTSPVIIEPWPHSDEAYFAVLDQGNSNPAFPGQQFRGSAVILLDGSFMIVANLVGLEQYLWSVVSSEIPSSWHKEALKAQAVASRTYAVYKGCLIQPESIRSAADIKVWADESSQVYRGKLKEDPRAVEACNETVGQILTYQDMPAATHFHADSAGMTESSRYVWGGNVPYLVAVEEVPHESPHARWEVSIDGATLGQKLKGVTGSSQVEMIAGYEPGESGRWYYVSVVSGNRSVDFKATEFRSLLDLKSMWFSVFRKGGGRDTLGQLNPGHEVYVHNGTAVEAATLKQCTLWNPAGSRVAAAGAYVIAPREEGPITFVFQGRGYGHGVGLSQWGAKAMAENGADYREILMHYYPSTRIETWW